MTLEPEAVEVGISAQKSQETKEIGINTSLPEQKDIQSQPCTRCR